MIRRKFHVQSLEKIGTIAQDLDQGVIRVAGSLLRELGGRNTLVKISVIVGGRAEKSIVRILRAATGQSGLTADRVALQYDDRLFLGVDRAGEPCELSIRRVNEWTALPIFLLRHSSPLVRREAAFALALMISGAAVGFFLGLLI